MAAINKGNAKYDSVAMSGVLSVPAAIDILREDTVLCIADRGDLTITSDEDVENVLSDVFSFSYEESPWRASILVQSPYSVALATRARPTAAVLFDRHQPVVSVSGPAANLQSVANFMEHFFRQQLGAPFLFAKLSILQALEE